MDRRSFLASAGVLNFMHRIMHLGSEVGGQLMARDGVQLYWFSQLAAREKKPFDDMLPEYLAMIAEAGFSAIETNLSYCATDESTQAFADRLKAAGLGLVGLYSGGAFHHAEGASAAVRTILGQSSRAKAIGCPGINCNPDPIGREKTDAELRNQASALNDVGAALAEMGLFLGVHTHAPEMSHNAREFRHNLEATNAAVVGLCADFHWMYRGGGDPYALTKQYASRIVSTHLRNSVEAVWAESFCAGDLDYSRLRDLLAEVGYGGPLTVEIAWEERTSVTRLPLETLKISRAYLRELFGV